MRKKIPTSRQGDYGALPHEVWEMIIEYISNPEDHFNLKAACSALHDHIPPKFLFKGLTQIVTCGIRKSAKYRNLGLTQPLILPLLAALCDVESLPPSLPFAVFDALPDSELEFLPLLNGEMVTRIADGFFNSGRDVLSPLSRSRHSFVSGESDSILHMGLVHGCSEEVCVGFMFRYDFRIHDIRMRWPLIKLSIIRDYSLLLKVLQLSNYINLNRTYDGTYPLQFACQNGSAKVLHALLLLGARPDQVRYRNGCLPLVHAAAWRGDLEMLRHLEQRKADFKAVNFQGEDVLTLLRGLIRAEKDVDKQEKYSTCYRFVTEIVSYMITTCVPTVAHI
jgi:hypothetical protein